MIVPHELDILVYWMIERDRIRTAKEAGKPKPWTTDPLLRDYRWCNVRRMDDRVSVWLAEQSGRATGGYRVDAGSPTPALVEGMRAVMSALRPRAEEQLRAL